MSEKYSQVKMPWIDYEGASEFRKFRVVNKPRSHDEIALDLHECRLSSELVELRMMVNHLLDAVRA